MPARGGYDVGKAFVQVLPSFKDTQLEINKFFSKMKPINIPASIDSKQFGNELEKAAREAAKQTTVDLGKPKLDLSNVAKEIEAAGKNAKLTIQADLDTKLADAKQREFTSRRVAIVAKIDLDIGAVEAQLAALRSQTPEMGVDISLNEAKLETQLAALRARKERIEVELDTNAATTEAELAAVEAQVAHLDGKTANINVESSSASRAIGIMALLTAGIAAAGYAAPAAAAAIAAIPAAIGVAGQGIGTLLFAFNGIGGALKAFQAADDDGAKRASANAKSRESSANQIASAESALASAQTAADHSAISGAEQVQSAKQALARAVESAGQAQESSLRRVQDAERSLASAQATARDAQQALNDARVDAKERIDDLKLSLKGVALDEESASLALEKAQLKLQALKDAGVGPTTLDYREADVAARQAAQSVDEVRERYSDLQKQAVYAAKTGVEGDKQVIAAHKQADAATVRVQDSERALSQARTDGARQVAQAQAQVASATQAVSQAQEHAAWANEAAVKAVADAQRNLGAAAQKAGDDGAAAMDKLNLAMSKLSPEGRDFVTFLQREVKPALSGIGNAVQAALLPKFQIALGDLVTIAPDVTSALTGTADAIGDLAIQGAKMVTSGPWRTDFSTIARNNNTLLETLGGAAFNVADAFRNIMVASGPMLQDFAVLAQNAAKTFAAFIQGKRDNGELTAWFHEMGTRLKEVLTVVKDVAVAIWDLAAALAPLTGIGIFKLIDELAKMITALSTAHPLLTNIVAIAGLAASVFIYLGKGALGVYGAFKKGAKGFELMGLPLRRVRDGLQSTADSTSRFAGIADAMNHPVARARQTISDLGDAYKTGADRTRAWITAHENLGLVGKGIDAVSDAGSRFANVARTAIGDGLDRMSTAIGGRFVAASFALTNGLDRARDAVSGFASDVTDKLAKASFALHDNFANAGEGLFQFGRTVKETVLTAADNVGPALGNLGTLLRTALSDPAGTASRAMDRVATSLYVASGAVGKLFDGGGRLSGVLTQVSTSVQTGFNRVMIESASVVDKLSSVIQNGLNRAAVVADGILSRIGNTLTSTVLKPLVDAKTAYQDTTTKLREFSDAQTHLQNPLRENEGILGRLRNAFSGLSTVASGVGSGVRAALEGPLTAVKNGLSNVAQVAGGAAAVLGKGLVKAADGVISAFGGPWGIAIAAAFVGLDLLSQHSQEAAAALEANKKRVDDLASALRDSKGAIDSNVRSTAASALADFDAGDGKRNLLDDARKLGIQLPKLTDAYLGNGDALKSIVGNLRDTAEAHSHFQVSGRSSVKVFDDVGKSANQLADIMEKEGGNFQNAAQKNRDLADATGPLTDKTKELTTAQINAANATAGFNTKLALIRDTAADVTTAGQAILDFLDQLNGKVPSVDDAADRLNTDIRKLAGGFKDAKGNLIDLSKGFIGANGEIDSTTETGSQLRSTVKELSADMAGAGKAAFDQARTLGKSLPDAYQAAVDAMNPYVTKVHDALKANGATEDQIGRLLGAYHLVPPDIATTILLAGDKVASEQVSNLLGNLNQLPPNVPVTVNALTGVAQEALIQLGYHIVTLPDGTFKVFSNTAEGQRAADDFVARNDGRAITMDMAVKTAAAQQALDDFKNRNSSFDLHPVLTGSGNILYTGPDGNTRILGTNLRMDNAMGRIIEFYASGGFNQLNKMSSKVATVVPPNTMRVIGDRAQGDEAFIPINRSPRSIDILMETAKRMGFALSPLAAGGLLAFADGAVASTDPASAAPSSTASTPDASKSADSMTAAASAAGVLTAAIVALQAATIAYTTAALGPQVAEINGAVLPALNQLAATLTPVQDQYRNTQAVITSATGAMVVVTSTMVTQINGQLQVLRTGLQQTGQAFQSTSDWVHTSWGNIREYAAAPTRDVLNGPFSNGLIAAWNYLDSSFGLNHHLNPIAVPFAEGGPVRGPGTGTSDSILTRLSNGEYVIPAALTKRILPFLEALRMGQAEALQAAGYAGGGLVADTGSALNAIVARAQIFAAQQQGKPYIWGGVGPTGYDCSGFMSAITNVMRGEANPYKRLGQAANEPWPGFVRGLSTAFAMGASPVHTAGTLGGVNAESTGNHVRFGGDAHGADDFQFNVQSSLPLAGGQFVSGGGGTFDPAALVASAFTDTAAMIQNVIGKYPGNTMARTGGGEAGYASGKLQKIAVDQLAINSVGGGPAVAAAQNFARSALPRFGWGPEQMAPLIALWNGESGWNYQIANKSSGAYGIPQALPPEKMASVGPDWRTNPATQILWGLGYIKDRPDYGSPSAAYAKWLSRSPHWYDDGGWLPPGYSTVANHTGKPEAVLTQDQWNSLTTMAGLKSGGGRDINVYARTDASPEHIAHVIDRRLAIGSRL